MAANSLADRPALATGVDGHAHVWVLAPERYPWQPLVPGLRPPASEAPVEALIAASTRPGCGRRW